MPIVPNDQVKSLMPLSLPPVGSVGGHIWESAMHFLQPLLSLREFYVLLI